MNTFKDLKYSSAVTLMYITKYSFKTFQKIKTQSTANTNLPSRQGKDPRRNLIPLWHISISQHGHRECPNSACDVEILVGHIKWTKNQQIEDVPAEQLLYSKVNVKTLGNVSRLASIYKKECWKCAFHLRKTWNYCQAASKSDGSPTSDRRAMMQE